MATFIINSVRPVNKVNNKSVELPPKGSLVPNVNSKDTIGSIVFENPTYLFRANSAAPMQYDRVTPLSINYTDDLGGVAKSLSTGNFASPPLNNSVVIRTVLANTTIANGGFDFVKGKFAEPPPVGGSTVCPDRMGTSFNSQTTNTSTSSCVQEPLAPSVESSYIDVVIYASGHHVVMEAEGFIGDEIVPEMTNGTSTEGYIGRARYYNGWVNTVDEDYWEMFWCAPCTFGDDITDREDTIEFWYAPESYLPLFISDFTTNIAGLLSAGSEAWGDQGIVASKNDMNLRVSSQYVSIPPYYKGAFKNRAVLENTSLIPAEKTISKQWNLILDSNLDTKIVSNAVPGFPISVTVRSTNVEPLPAPPPSYLDITLYQSGTDVFCHLKADLTIAQHNLRSITRSIGTPSGLFTKDPKIGFGVAPKFWNAGTYKGTSLGVTIPPLSSLFSSTYTGIASFNSMTYGPEHTSTRFTFTGQENIHRDIILLSDTLLLASGWYTDGVIDITFRAANKTFADLHIDTFGPWSGFFEDGTTPWSLTVVAP